jgi:predicted nuclease of predicted toxin-antitoxin system
VRVLIDSCVWGGVAAALRGLDHDVEAATDWPEDPGDAEVLAHAHASSQVLVTLDKDFGELVVVHGRPHAGIVRLVQVAAREQATACGVALERYGEALERGAIVTVEPGRVRVREAD